MNYDSARTPRPQNYGRFTGRFYFAAGVNLSPLSVPAGTSFFDLGNCTGFQPKHGMKGTDVTRWRDGVGTRVDSPVTDVNPEMSITIDELRIRKTIPLRIFGAQNSDAVQAAATASTLAIPAVYQSNSYDLGARNVANVTVKIGATSAGVLAVRDTDYQLHESTGQLTIMEGAIPDSTTQTPSPIFITYDIPALTRASFTSYTTLNQYGLLRWFRQDTFGPTVAVEEIAYVNLMPDDPGAQGQAKVVEDKLTAKILSPIYRLDRKD